MASIKTTGVQTLKDALEAGARTDDLDAACLVVQEVLGVEDGGFASVVFSDLADGTGPDSWAALSVSDRHDRLIDYVTSEMRHFDDPGRAPDIEIPGFERWTTGGGCMALGRELVDGSRWLVTDEDGSEIPTTEDVVLVGHQSGDFGEERYTAEFEAGTFDVDAFVARVAASEAQANAEFEAFRATRRVLGSRDYGKLIGDAMWEDEPEMQFLVYEDQSWIEITGDNQYCLVLENAIWTTGPDTDLVDLEKKLFAYGRPG